MSGKSPAKYDETYKKLFTNSVLVEELMRYFVDEKLANELDFTTLESLETTSYSQDLEKRENDRILKIKRKSGGELYLLLMLEFQSSNDFSMAVRILNYVARLYEEITKTHGNNASLSLPAVFPVVLYNGDTSWTAKTSLRALRDGDEDWKEATSLFDLRYHLIDCARAERVDDSFVSLLFRLEHPRSTKAFKADLIEFAELVCKMIPARMLGDLQSWFRHVLEKKTHGKTLTDEEIAYFFPEDGMFKMNRTRLDRVLDELAQESAQRIAKREREEGLREGIEQGLEQGLEQGRHVEGRRMLGLLLTQRFGVDESREDKLASLGLDEIEAATSILLKVPDETTFWVELLEG